MSQPHKSLLTLALFLTPSLAAITWPNPLTDPLEDLYVQSNFGGEIVPCSSSFPGGLDIQTPAEWVRTAYHDMATHDVTSGTGGIDASIGFELARAENLGAAFSDSLGFFAPFQTPTTSMSDLIALGAILSIRSCSGGAVNIPLQAGRVDAVAAGPSGVPVPSQDLATHTATFKKQGFNQTEMIGLVACGHTIGGVHARDFPNITAALNPNDPLDSFHFDTTFSSFDNAIATEFVAGTTKNPLIVGPNATNSDSRIFNSDGAATMKSFASSNAHYLSTCQNLLQRMVNTVPAAVTLSPVITPLTVKPQNVVVQFNEDQTLSLSGNIRLLFPARDDTRTVTLHLTPRAGGTTTTAVSAPLLDGSQDTFLFGNISLYQFNATIPVATGVSSFTVEVKSGGVSTTFNNGGSGFPVTDTVAFEPQHSCLGLESNGVRRNFTIAVADKAKLSAVTMQWHTLTTLSPSPAFGFSPKNATLVKGSAIGTTGYTKYSFSGLDSVFNDFTAGTYDVSAVDSTGKQVSFTGAKMSFC